MRNKRLVIIFSIIAAIALIIILSSVIFSVRNVNAYCYNENDTELEQQVITVAEKKKGKSIFFLSTGDLIAEIEASNVSVKVINIERAFPNRLIVNFYVIKPYIAIPQENGTFLICDNLGKILEVREAQEVDFDSLVTVDLQGILTSTSVNSYFNTTVSGERESVAAILNALDQLNYRELERVHFIEEIRFESEGIIILQTRSGVKFKFFNSVNMVYQMQSAVSLYIKNDPMKYNGTITVSRNDIAQNGYQATHSFD